MKDVVYPTIHIVIGLNDFALTFSRMKKSDKHEVMSHSKIVAVIEECQLCTGDIYDKAVILLKGIIQQHPFASGNRRTAFILLKYFLQDNNLKCGIKDTPENAYVLQGIRERYYSDAELKEWIRNGEIRKFIR